MVRKKASTVSDFYFKLNVITVFVLRVVNRLVIIITKSIVTVDQQTKLTELTRENANLRSQENEVSPMKTALSQFKEESRLLLEKVITVDSR